MLFYLVDPTFFVLNCDVVLVEFLVAQEAQSQECGETEGGDPGK